MTQGIIFPVFKKHEPAWPQGQPSGDIGAEGMFYADAISKELANPPADWLVLTRDYASQYTDTAALEPDNANGWYDAAKQELHLVVPTQSPMEVAQNTASMLAKSRLGLNRLFLHPFYTVGYGSKDHYDMPYYALVAAAYGGGLPVRLANDRFEQFQTSLKRHEFRMRYTMAVDRTQRDDTVVPREHDRQRRRPRKLFRLHCHGRCHGGAVDLLSAEKRSSCDCHRLARCRCWLRPRLRHATIHGGDRDDGGRDRRDARSRPDRVPPAQRVEVGHEEHPGSGTSRRRPRRRGTRAGTCASALDRPCRAQERRTTPLIPGNITALGSAACRRISATATKRRWPRSNSRRTGASPSHIAAPRSAPAHPLAQAVAAVRWLGRPADKVQMPVTDWPDLIVETSGDPYTMEQTEQDRLARNPRWSPNYASASSASNSAYYFAHATREAARIVFRHGLWPAALTIWQRGVGGGQAAPLVVREADARWVNGHLTADGLQPLPLAQLTKRSPCPRAGYRRGGAHLQPLAMGGSEFPD